MKDWDSLLEVGDIVVVHSVLFKTHEFPVLRIEGNKAFTKFRTFNRKIYHGNVYEYGKKFNHSPYANICEVKTGCGK